MYVLADDLSGAAELGGVAWRHGLKVLLGIEEDPGGGAQCSVISTGSRLLPPRTAAARVARLAAPLRGRWVFKKTDSVLRGPVAAELEAVARVLGLGRTLLVPCNPSLGRTIEGGRYLVAGVPLHRTEFGRDPAFPARSARLGALLRRPRVAVLEPGGPLPERGLAVGAAVNLEQMAGWASAVKAGTLPAGAADFFSALLAARGLRARRPGAPQALARPWLLVSGTASEAARQRLERLAAQGVPLSYPASEGTAAAAAALAQTGCAAIATPVSQVRAGFPQPHEVLAGHAVELLAAFPGATLCIEGGATAAAVLALLGWRALRITREWGPGVVAVRPLGAAGTTFVLKPGSYGWEGLRLG